MQLRRGEAVAGVEPELARRLARACHHFWMTTVDLAERVAFTEPEVTAMLRRLADAGFLQRRDASWPGEADEWTTTLRGGDLTTASFLSGS